jgi:hypothetical protein
MLAHIQYVGSYDQKDSPQQTENEERDCKYTIFPGDYQKGD